jgi:hypothetical protein
MKRNHFNGWRVYAAVVLLAAAWISLACSGATPLVAGPAGSKSVSIEVADGIRPDMRGDVQKAHRDLAKFIERDMAARLTKSGFRVAPESADYQIKMDLLNYNPGSKAARAFVGFGAGACSVDLSLDMTGPQGSLLSTKDGVGSSRDWRYCVQVLNKRFQPQIVSAVK